MTVTASSIAASYVTAAEALSDKVAIDMGLEPMVTRRRSWEELTDDERNGALEDTVRWNLARVSPRLGVTQTGFFVFGPKLSDKIIPLVAAAGLNDMTVDLSMERLSVILAPHWEQVMLGAYRHCRRNSGGDMGCVHAQVVEGGEPARRRWGAAEWSFCPICFDATNHAVFLSAETYFVACVGGGRVTHYNGMVIAELEQQWYGGNGKRYWRATDELGRRWHGCTGRKTGYTRTIMVRSSPRACWDA